MDLSIYIHAFSTAIRQQNPVQLRYCLTIMPGADGPMRAAFPEPSDFDLYQVPEKFQPVLQAHLRLMRAIHKDKNLEASFDQLNDMVGHLIRAGDSQTNWINDPLINSLNELMAMYKMKESRNPESSLDYESEEEEDEGVIAERKKSSLEQLANTLNKAFKLSLNDKSLDFQQSKRVDIYYFLAALIKVYFRMNKLELAKSIEKAVKGTRFELPDMIKKSSPLVKKLSVIYLYYTTLLALDDCNYSEAENKLVKALEVLRYYDVPANKQTRQVLFLLLVVKLYNSRVAPPKNHKVWTLYPELAAVYRDDLFASVARGDLHAFDCVLDKYKVVFLRTHLYIIVELLRLQVCLNLVRKTTALTMEQGGNHIVSLHAYQIAFEMSTYNMQAVESGHLFQVTLDEVECILANLIAQGRIKGYLSHANRCIVLSKTTPFP